MQLIVSGTGRCGTVYLARLLTSLGIPCGHESIFTPHDLIVALNKIKNRSFNLSNCSMYDALTKKKLKTKWVDPKTIVADSSFMSAPFLEHFSEVPLIHLVRNPLAVITSYMKDLRFFTTEKSGSIWLQFMYEHLPELTKIDNQIERACYFYVHWNNMIENSTNKKLFWRLEDTLNDNFFNFIGVPTTDNYFKEKVNSKILRKRSEITLNEIPAGNIKNEFIKKAIQYGYAHKTFL